MQKTRCLLQLSILCSSAVLSANADIVTTNLLTNPGAETGSISGWTVGGTSNPSVDKGTFDVGINPHTGSFDFYGHTGRTGTLSQIVSLIGVQGITQADVNTGDLSAIVSFWEQGLNQATTSDDARIQLEFLGAGNADLGIVNTSTIDSHNGTWTQGTGSFLIPVGTQKIEYTMDFIRHVGTDNDSFIDDNSLVVTGARAIAPVPEPDSLVLVASGAAMVGFMMFRRKRTKSGR